MYAKESKEVVIDFWRCISSKKWNEIQSFISDEFEAYWPHSKEKMGRDDFLSFNERRFENHTLELSNVNYDYDQWDKYSTVITQIHAYPNKTNEDMKEVHVISFFQIDDRKITGLVEYRT